MWIFTVNGFFTVIQDRKDPAFVWLRSRLREDIERNFPGVEVQEHPGADYLFRAKLPREQVAQRLFELAMENNVTSHFKDVMIRTASKPEFGSRSNMLYGVWNSGAAMQPYAPYSKVPRSKAPVKTWKPGDRTTGTGQTRLPATGSQGLYGGMGAGRYASEFDWDASAWGTGGGVSHPDPRPGSTATDEEFEEWWAGLSPIERDEYLDAAEDEQRRREETDEDFGAAARAAEFLAAPQVADVFPAPRSRAGNRKQRRKARRANRHNQERTAEQHAQFAQERREGRHGREAQNRQAFLDKQSNGKGA
jgi:hypothetical protein